MPLSVHVCMRREHFCVPGSSRSSLCKSGWRKHKFSQCSGLHSIFKSFEPHGMVKAIPRKKRRNTHKQWHAHAQIQTYPPHVDITDTHTHTCAHTHTHTLTHTHTYRYERTLTSRANPSLRAHIQNEHALLSRTTNGMYCHHAHGNVFWNIHTRTMTGERTYIPTHTHIDTRTQ